MESYIQISKLNDFIFCPMSLYFHSFYENYEEKIYHGKSQTVGKIAHDNIDKGKYSTARRYLQGLPIYSSRFNLMGKIDIYDSDMKFLIERKYKVNKIYRGYLLQLYAQFFCLEEMGVEVEKMFIHSLSDNKRYEIPRPRALDEYEFGKVINKIKCFDPLIFNKDSNPNKCDNCIYRELCNR